MEAPILSHVSLPHSWCEHCPHYCFCVRRYVVIDRKTGSEVEMLDLCRSCAGAYEEATPAIRLIPLNLYA